MFEEYKGLQFVGPLVFFFLHYTSIQMKTRFLIVFVLLPFLKIVAAEKKVRLFSLNEVQVSSGVFKQAAETDFHYMQAMNPDRLLAPYLREAGLKPKAESYTNWENTGLDGHILGHYLSALSMYYASTADADAEKLLDYVLSELKLAQIAGKGYLGGIPGSEAMWNEIKAGQVKASSFGLNGKWVPLYNIHKIFAGLKDAWVHAQKPEAKQILIDLTDWFICTTENLSAAQVQDMLRSEHGGLNEVFAEVYAITQDHKYLQLAKRFSQLSVLQPLAENKDILTGMHANTQIPKFIGFERISQLDHDTEYHQSASNFFENVTQHRSLSIGGNSVREHFHPVDDFGPVIRSEEGPETCNSYNMLKLSKLLFEDTAKVNYVDFYERTLYNHILSSQNPKGGFVYFTPMRPGHYRVYSQPETSFWCCVGSGLENHTKYNEFIYAKDDQSLYVNLFIPSKVNWKEKMVEVEQITNFPESASTQLVWKSEKSVNASLKIRYPSWMNKNELEILINGKSQQIIGSPGQYIELNRKWKNQDVVDVKFKMHLGVEELPDNSGFVSLKYGPIVLAAITGENDQLGLFADDSTGGHIAKGPFLPMTEAPMFISDEKDKLVQNIKPIPGENLRFTVENVIYPEQYKNLVLEPFYKIHEKRYSIYFKNETKEWLDQTKKLLEEQQKAEELLQSITLDYVAPGEQQPESDHGFKSENSSMGTHQNRHWRDARGWFSYNLQNVNLNASVLRLTYFGLDKGREFTISINGNELARENFTGNKGDGFFEIDYKLPMSIVQDSKLLEVKFEAINNSVTAGIYGVRLIK